MRTGNDDEALRPDRRRRAEAIADSAQIKGDAVGNPADTLESVKRADVAARKCSSAHAERAAG